MLRIASSGASKPNVRMEEIPRKRGENNLDWMARAAPGDSNDATHLLLVGGSDKLSFRLRVAQSHARDDMTPSSWSHIALFRKLGRSVGATHLLEIGLDPPGGFGWAPARNGVQEGRLRSYGDPSAYPNLAVLRVPVPWKTTRAYVEEFARQRRILDANELVITWLAFAWGVSATSNPLLEGNGIPAASLVETVLGAAGYDITPGLDSRASCPEAVWQAVRWWHPYYDEHGLEPPAGAYVRDQRIFD